MKCLDRSDFCWVLLGMFAWTWSSRLSPRSPGPTSSPPAGQTGAWSTVRSTRGEQEPDITSRISRQHTSQLSIVRNVAFNISQCQAAAQDQDEVFDAMKSFPSGHAQVACFTSTFLIVSRQEKTVERLSWLSWLSNISDLPPAAAQTHPVGPSEVLAAAGAGPDGRHLLHQSDHGQQAPRRGCLGGGRPRYPHGSSGLDWADKYWWGGEWGHSQTPVGPACPQ